MTQRASDLLAEVADRLSTDATQSGMVVAEAVRAIEPELLKGYKDGSIDELVNMSISFLRALFRSLRPDSKLPWPEYYTQAREYARRYAEKGVPLESLMEGLAIFRRTVVARRRAAQAGQDDRHAAGRGGRVLRLRAVGPDEGAGGFDRSRRVARRPHRGGVERDPGRAQDERSAA